MEESRSLYDLGRTHMDAGDLDEAVALLEKSVAAYPHFKTLELLGECFLKQGRPRQAIVPLAAAALNEQSRAPSLLADVFFQLGQPHNARRFAELALARGPGNRRAKEVLQKLPPG